MSAKLDLHREAGAGSCRIHHLHRRTESCRRSRRRATNDSPPAVIVAIIRIDAVCDSPVSGFVQLVVPSHCIAELENDVNVMVWSELSRPALGNALEDVPQ